MAFKYSLLFALLAVVAIQSATALHVNNPEERSLTDIISAAKKAIEKLINTVRNAVESAINKLGQIKDDIINKAKELVNKAIQGVKDEIQKIKDTIEKIKETAANLGVDIKECNEVTLPLLEQLPKYALKKLVQCAKDEVAKAGEIVESAVNEIIKIKDSILDLPGELVNCKVDIKCIGNVIGDAVNGVTSIPSLITGKIGQVIQLVANIENDLRTCTTKVAIDVTKEAGAIGIKFAKCVADKIKE